VIDVFTELGMLRARVSMGTLWVFHRRARWRRRGEPISVEGTIVVIASDSRRRRVIARAISGFVAVAVGFASTARIRADAVYTGDGLGAWVNTFDQTAYQTGGAPAVISTATTVNYTNYDMNNNAKPGSVIASVYASGAATPGGATLLQMQTSLLAPAPGRFGGPMSPGTETQGAAYWGNVTTTVGAPAGASMPSSIRLDFQVNYSPADANAYFGTRTAYLSMTGSPLMLLPAAGSIIKYAEPPAQMQADGTLTASFHLDVPLSSSGVSASPFAISMVEMLPGITNSAATSLHDKISVSLTGIDLPDGTPLLTAGYSVTFNSVPGPLAIETAPEPATWATWGVMAAVGALMLRRRTRVCSFEKTSGSTAVQ
jgi:hypothetical protein